MEFFSKRQSFPLASKSSSSSVSGLPPWHTIVVLAACAWVAWTYLPSWTALDATLANAAVMRRTLGYLTLRQVAISRLVLGAIMLGDSLYAVLWGRWEQDTEYYPGSRLQPSYRLPFRGVFVERPYSLSRGLMTLSSFTMWAWFVEGCAFVFLGYIAWSDTESISNDSMSPAIYRVTAVLWEIAAPTTLLVSSIVKYILWPHALQGIGDANSNVLQHWGALLEHNLNSIAALVEVGFFGGLPVLATDASLAVSFGLIYVAYTYAMAHSWPQGQPLAPSSSKCHIATPKHKKQDEKTHRDAENPTRNAMAVSPIIEENQSGRQPQFIYPFFDPTLPGYGTTYCLLGLLSVLLASHLLFCLAREVLIPQAPWIVVPILAAAVCRFS